MNELRRSLRRVHLSGYVGACAAIMLTSTVLLGMVQAPAFAATSPAGTVGNTTSGAHNDPPLTSLASVSLPTGSGAIQAVVYAGANTTEGGSLAQTLTGFTVPSSPFTADATAIVADGQLPGNTFTLAGTGLGVLDENAFPGADPHPSGWSYGGLWDTRNYNETLAVNAGDTSVSDTESGNGDCITSVAQVFATGPSAAFNLAGYVADGVGLRNQGSGTITVSGIPAGASVTNAYLFWANINPTDPGEAMDINGTSVTGSTDGTDVSPCWGNGNIYTHSANVTSLVNGNGTYSLAGYATGATGGGNPWGAGAVAPLMEGASLVVFYSHGAKSHTSTDKFCAKGQPTIGSSEVKFKPCMTVTDTYNGNDAESVSIKPPATSTKPGGCPSFVSKLFSELDCSVTGTSSHKSGSGVVDQVTMSLTWQSNVVFSTFFQTCIVTSYEYDTMTMSVTTSASGKHNEQSSVTFDSSPEPIFICS